MKQILFIFLAGLTLKATPLKVINDGHSAFCPPTSYQSEQNSKKALRIDLLGKKRTAKTLELTLTVKVVTCLENQWTQDFNPSTESYLTQDEKNQEILVNLFYSQARLKVIDDNYKLIQEVALKDLLHTGTETIKITIPLTSSKSYELAFFTEKAITAPHHFDKSTHYWGSFYLNFN